MIKHKLLYYCLLSLWPSLAPAVDFDTGITANAQWMLNTNNGSSQALNLTLLPEFSASFENG